MIKKIFKILIAKKDFFPPKKDDILIIDDNFKFFLEKKIKHKKFEYLDIRYKRLNIFVIIKLLFSKEKKNFFNYVLEYIKTSNAKKIITFNDNLEWFYKIKIFLPKIQTFSFQNGFRNKFFFENLKNYKHLAADKIFVFNEEYGKLFRDRIKTKTISFGSIKNNFMKKKCLKKKRKSLLFVSFGYRKKEYLASYEKKNGFKFKASVFYEPEIELFKNIINYCKLRNLTLEVSPKDSSDKNEFKFYKDIAKNFKFIYHKNSHQNMLTYDLSDQVLASISTHSTFGPENLARGNRTAIFNNKKIVSDGIYDVFWYLKIKNKGCFWSDEVSFAEVQRVLNFVVNSSNLIWRKKTISLNKILMKHETNNEKVFKIFEKKFKV